jgi:hypothetical protein
MGSYLEEEIEKPGKRLLGVMVMSEGLLPDVASPTRAQVEVCWQALAAGRVARADAHAWAAKWVEGEGLRRIPDQMVRNALQHLHGYDMARDSEHPEIVRHSSSGNYVRSLQEVAGELDRWLSDCEAYDVDPKAYAHAAKERALRALNQPPDPPLT